MNKRTGRRRSPLFWQCQCQDRFVHFTDDDICSQCGGTEATSKFATVEMIRRFLPYIPLEHIPQQTRSGIVFAGSPTAHPVDDMGVCSAVEEAFFEIRALIREHRSDEAQKP